MEFGLIMYSELYNYIFLYAESQDIVPLPTRRGISPAHSQPRAFVLCSLSERRPKARRIWQRRLSGIDPATHEQGG
jgi:hypothetical protein